MKQLSQAPSFTDINIGNRLKELRDFNDGNMNDDRNNNNDDDDDGPGVPPTPSPRFRLPSPLRDKLPERDLNEAQSFLLQGAQPENANVSEPARQQQIAIAAIPRWVTFSDNVKHIFPEVKKILAAPDTEPDVDLEAEADRSEVRAIAEEILRRISEDVQFFSSDSGGKALFACTWSIIGSLSEDTEKFLDYLTTSNSTRRPLKGNNYKIHLHNGQFYVKNRIVEGDSLYDFLIVQEDKTKPTIKQKFALTKDFDYYNNEILSNITNDGYDLMTNSTSKFIFYHYNAVRDNEGLKPAAVRHSQILKDENALKQLQNRDWQYNDTTPKFN